MAQETYHPDAPQTRATLNSPGEVRPKDAKTPDTARTDQAQVDARKKRLGHE